MKLALLAAFLALPLFSQTLTNPNCPGATAPAGVMPHCGVFTWTAPASGATSYNMYRTTTTGACNTNPATAQNCTKVNAAPITNTNYTDNSSTTNTLSEGPTYQYVVTSVIGTGESVPTAPVSGVFPTLVPGTPTGLAGNFK